LEIILLPDWKVVLSVFPSWKVKEYEMADRTDPRDALAAIERTEGRLATRMYWPLHRHAAAGVLQALFVVAWALPLPYMGALFAVAVAMMTLIAEADRKRDGMFVSGMVSKSGIPAIVVAIALTLGGIAAVTWFAGGPGMWHIAAVPVAIVVAVGVTLASLWWEKLYQAELRREQAA
jgi:hypothetical protein